MEEVLAHVHPGPIVPDVLSRQYEHRSGLIWNGDHETCYTDLQCRHFGRNLFQCYSTAPRRLAVVHGSIGGCTTNWGGLSLSTDLDVIQADPLAPLGAIWCILFDCSQLPTHTLFIWLPYYDRPLFPSNLWRAEVPLICYEIVEYHYPGHVMCQFARAQMVLDACDTLLDLHRIQLRGNNHTY
ncbi:hypothetical protein M9H77_34964 [Catharanthus roseus]|uniref:Uncharacterized protein n=1 Tax=Catharanthus roseus TaxID=4058 RepID=A0ACB9ZPD3_CATRO|nr:hypothetical protein M9H77_34964 [Catharanthus roseus]